MDIFWQLNLNVLELGNPPLEADAVGISGTLQHSVTLPGPHEEGPGPIFSFGLIFNAAIGSGTTDIGPKVLPHEQHTDTFFAGIQWLTNPEKIRILSYSLTVYGNHPDPVPETEAILLFGTGLASLGLALRKRFRS